MRKTSLLIIAALLACSCSGPVSVPPSVLGGKLYDSARAILVTGDSFLLAGLTQSAGVGGVDMYLLQTDKRGRIKKQNTYGGKGDDRAFAIAGSKEQGFMLAGYTTSYGAGNNDVYIVKTDVKGNYISAKTFGGSGFEEGRGICPDGTGGYIIAGHTNSFGENGYDAYVIRVDADGNCVWAKTFGGAGNERINSVTQAGQEKFLIAGSSNSRTMKLPDSYILAVGLNGNLISENYYGDAYHDDARDIIITQDGNAVIAAEKGSKESIADITLMKTGVDGNLIWEKKFGGAQSDYPVQVIETKDGGFAVAAVTESYGNGMSDMLVMKTDKDGRLLWEKVFGGREDEYAGGIAEDADAGLAVVGWTRSYGTGEYDVYLVKLDKNGFLR